MVKAKSCKQAESTRRADGISTLDLTPQEREELRWMEVEAPPAAARRARIILLFSREASLAAVARRLGIDRSTVRRWVRRFRDDRLKGLIHGAAGQPKCGKFGVSVRDAIVRLAMASPHEAGEPFDTWSLRRLREHVVRRGLVRDVSVEGLRQLLRGVPLPAEFWQRKPQQLLQVSAEARVGLEQLLETGKPELARRARLVLARANGLQESEIAAAMGVGESTVRYWLRRFRKHGILGLQTQRKRVEPATFTPEVRRKILAVAAQSPADYGLGRSLWSLRTLRTVLMQRGVVSNVSIQHLRRILGEAGVDLRAPLLHHPELPSRAN